MLARGFARELADRLRASSHPRLNEPTMTGHEIESRASPSKSCRCDAGSPAARAADRSCGKAAYFRWPQIRRCTWRDGD